MNLWIKNVPGPVVERLRERAKRRHRSLQGELLAIVETAAEEQAFWTPDEILNEVKRLGVKTPSESADMIRVDRDGR